MSSMSVSKVSVGRRANMAVEGNVPLAIDAFSRERGISLHLSKVADFPAREQKRRSPWSLYPRIVSLVCVLLVLLYFALHDTHLGRLVRRGQSDQVVVLPALGDGVLEVFQVNAPVAVDDDECKVLLMEHSFGFSYGKPFVGNYNPPSCKFKRVVMNFTVTSRGRQFDRLALMYLNDTEVWRTSTAEPTEAGIQWTYIKDMTPYLSMWRQPQKVIFDLGNLIDDKYTGAFNTTLSLTFSTASAAPPAAGLILPLSARRSASNSPSVFTLPDQRALTTHVLPRNANRATISLSACGQAAEEFWWSNVPSAAISTFTNTTGELPGFSPWREVQILIDGRLAGVQWPFPVIFTGGVVPGLWRPIVGIEAFDLREYEVDVSPWLGLLSDGAPHEFEIKVVGISGKTIAEEVGSSWLVTGKVFLWLDEPGKVTTGSPISIAKDGFGTGSKLATSQDPAGANVTLSTQISVHRELDIRSTITTAGGARVVSWSQQLTYANVNDLSAYGVTQFTNLSRTATDSLTSDLYDRGPSAKYSLVVDSEYRVDPEHEGDLAINATSFCEVEYRTGRGSVFNSGLEPGASGRVRTTQEGKVTYVSKNGASSGTVATKQVFVLEALAKGEPVEIYNRDVGAVGGVVVWDRGSDGSGGKGVEYTGAPAVVRLEESVGSVREVLGRGPGSTRKVLVMGGE
ncbi:hypothetical protein GMDG_07467 [Pseudogymnoascus destructans 20631-21]|uniref:Peptide N-acetyl-beta-D-glucosaminyl asparaginase amidase A N-terminal domain-containing protein n=2 Tax=Pseudogymnoascus destructans TaxID=655981 RepID=L8FXG2_PSED2|nr:hypothetical protein GMDG_07467 [Pseudogymnoascus destructans 20631-21]